MTRPYYVKGVTAHNNEQVTINLYEELEYSNGKSNLINLVNNTKTNIFDKPKPSLSEALNLKKDGLIHIDSSKIKEHSYGSWISDLSVISKIE